jgi:hypothetical protein
MVSSVDATLRVITAFVLFVWILLYGSVFEVPYSFTMVELHAVPFWRLSLVLLVLFGSIWSPRVGVLSALAVFLYLADLEKLTNPLVSLEKA